jgi:hypothetical protein
MAALIQQSQFANLLRSVTPPPDDRTLRVLLYSYCKLYQEDYWFDQLVEAFEVLDLMFEPDADNAELVKIELPRIRKSVEEAMGEYFISLNEVATAVYRLLDSRPLTIDDTIQAIGHVWAAHACNESPEEFMTREDQSLCKLVHTSW